MKQAENRPLVYSVKDLCRVCYTCVRECPVKAIRIIDGQAEVRHMFTAGRDRHGTDGAGDLEKIFEPFYTTYGIVKMHRGQIDVKSNSKSDMGPRGTEFIIKLPRKREL